MLKYVDFLIKLLPLVNPIIYCDREVNDEDDDGAGEDEKDDLAIKCIQQIPYHNRQLLNRLNCHNFHSHYHRRH